MKYDISTFFARYAETKKFFRVLPQMIANISQTYSLFTKYAISLYFWMKHHQMLKNDCIFCFMLVTNGHIAKFTIEVHAGRKVLPQKSALPCDNVAVNRFCHDTFLRPWLTTFSTETT